MSPAANSAQESENAWLANQQTTAAEIRDMLGKDTHVTLYAIEPYFERTWQWSGHKNGAEVLRGYPISDHAMIVDPNEQAQLLGSLADSIAGVTSVRFGLCFDPHHGLTIQKGDKKIDILVCFKCIGLVAVGMDRGGSCTITSAPAEIFDRIAAGHHLRWSDPRDVRARSRAESRRQISTADSFQHATVVFYGREIAEDAITTEEDGYRLRRTRLRFEVLEALKEQSERKQKSLAGTVEDMGSETRL